MAELLTERWTLVAAGVWLVATAAVGWKRSLIPACLGYPGVIFAWGLGVAHNFGLQVDLGHG